MKENECHEKTINNRRIEVKTINMVELDIPSRPRPRNSEKNGKRKLKDVRRHCKSII